MKIIFLLIMMQMVIQARKGYTIEKQEYIQPKEVSEYGLDFDVPPTSFEGKKFSEALEMLQARAGYKKALKNNRFFFGVKLDSSVDKNKRLLDVTSDAVFTKNTQFYILLDLLLRDYGLDMYFHQGFLVIVDSASIEHCLIYVTPTLKKYLKKNNLTVESFSQFLAKFCDISKESIRAGKGQVILVKSYPKHIRKIKAFIFLIDTGQNLMIQSEKPPSMEGDNIQP